MIISSETASHSINNSASSSSNIDSLSNISSLYASAVSRRSAGISCSVIFSPLSPSKINHFIFRRSIIPVY